MKPLNPASTEAVTAAERKRIPMAVPVMRLEVPPIPGYHLHWFNGTPERIERALSGGYEFVDEKEIKPNNVGLGGDSATSGNVDMGSRVSAHGGSEIGTDGQPIRMILMKIKQEWYEEDQKLVDQRNTKVADALTGGMLGAENDAPGDTQMRYLDKSRTKIPEFFRPKRPKVA